MSNQNQDIHNLWAIVLAAGKGTRMRSRERNKVALEIAGVPMLKRTIANIKGAGIKNIMIVVGFAKESVIGLLDSDIYIAHQRKRLGTGHAVKVGLGAISHAKDVLVLYGDDSYMYNADIIRDLYKAHTLSHATLSFLTLRVENPKGLGRIIRGKNNEVIGIVEEKDAKEGQKKITEINPACYIFSFEFLKKNIAKIPKSPVTNEYYLTSLIEMAFEQKVKIETVTVSNLKWRGVNTPEELKEAEQIIQS